MEKGLKRFEDKIVLVIGSGGDTVSPGYTLSPPVARNMRETGLL